MHHRATDIAVIGAGVIGLTVALHLADQGHAVVMVDPAPPGSGASHGNAGTVADYAVQPVGTPGVLRDLPRLLFDRDSPLAIRPGAMLGLTPWLARFLGQSLPGPAARNARALAGLLADATPRWVDLAAQIGATDLMRDRGCLYLYRSPGALAAAQADLDFRRRLGVTVQAVTAAELAAMEPGLPPMAGAAFFPQARFLTDPGAVMARLAAAVRRAGVEILPDRAQAIVRLVDGVEVTGPGLRLHARRVVIAAGAWSAALARTAGDRLPLDTERGYHVEWDLPDPPVTRPCCPTDLGFYLCPMQGRLRLAGTVELGGIEAPPSPRRIARLVQGARRLFPGLPERPDRDWMGLRPSIPDSLPVIGASARGAEVIHAYGHGHLGVTLAPRTAALVADLVAGRDPGPVAAAVAPGRFRAAWF
ncbi:MAG: FAD-binding oxidoreductase [Rhodobacterales bacterium]|nr:FAD-binding oxidoreductase [Rhodobacterales bacterium]